MSILKGETVASGVALGEIFLQGFAAEAGYAQRISSDQVEEELNRLRDALAASREQIETLKTKHGESLGSNELRIFDTHVGYLSDPKFVDEIENMVMKERLSVRSSIHKIVANYDRIFQLVENDYLQQRAGDLRDVATRVLRNLDDGPDNEPDRPQGRYILAAKKLSTSDMFNLDDERVEGIVAEEGGISSHAAILARSMGIPTITGIRDLPEKLENGTFVILDAGTGELHVRPDDRVREEYTRTLAETKSVEIPSADRAHATRDGVEIKLMASVGSVGEAGLSRSMGMDGIGLYRTELLFLMEEEQLPTEDVLTKQYSEVLHGSKGNPVNFRLLDVSSRTGVVSVPDEVERNPAMGMRGIRSLLQDGRVLRRQIRAILRAAADTPDVGILVPFVTGVSDIQRVKAAILEERIELRKKKIKCAEALRIAPIVEVPAAAFVLHAFLNEADFVVVAIDDLQAHLLAADRDNANVRDYYESVHPALFEIVARMSKDAKKAEKPLVLFGEGAADSSRIPFFVGVGITDFSVAPVRINTMLKTLGRFTVAECTKISEKILNAPRALDVQRVLVRLVQD